MRARGCNPLIRAVILFCSHRLEFPEPKGSLYISSEQQKEQPVQLKSVGDMYGGENSTLLKSLEEWRIDSDHNGWRRL